MLALALLQQCAPAIDPIVAQAIVKTESSFNHLAIGVNKGGRISQPKDYKQAVVTATRLINSGGNIDLGLAQINSKNLSWLKLPVESAFDPCANLKAMQTVYSHCYERAGNSGLGTRMQRAFSCYNTGNMTRGFKNGYVTKVTKNYNELQPLVAAALNKTTQPTIQARTLSPLPNNSSELADFATRLQSQQQTDVVVAVATKESWDIFRDF